MKAIDYSEGRAIGLFVAANRQGRMLRPFGSCVVGARLRLNHPIVLPTCVIEAAPVVEGRHAGGSFDAPAPPKVGGFRRRF